MKQTQSQRVLLILKDLVSGQTLCTRSLQERFGENSRTIQRDMKLLREFLGDALIQTGRGCYRLLTTQSFSAMLQSGSESRELRAFLEFAALIDEDILRFLKEEDFGFLRQIKRETKEIFTIFDNPVESLKKNDLLETLKTAVKDRRYCDLIYNETGRRDLKRIRPLKILYAQNNWYLVALTQNYKHLDGFKRFRINFIEEITLLPQTFHKDIQALEYLKKMQSLFDDYGAPHYDVEILADASVARHFRVKKYLKSQKIAEEKPNGDLILHFRINNDMEIKPLIRRWLPHLKVLSPKRLDESIKEEIETYLASG